MKWVLIVESSEVDREYLARITDRLGYRIYAAQSGEEALHYMKQSLPDTLIIGEHLPDYDPMVLGRSIKEDRILSSPPMLLMSSRTDQSLNQEASDAGFAEVVRRPMSIRKFFTSLELCISSNRRLCIRAPMSFPVQLKRGLEEQTMVTHNFGEGGMYISTPDPLPEKSEVDLDFKLPGLNNGFKFKGRVVHARYRDSDEAPAGMGIKFLNILPAIETVLGIYMENFLVRRVAMTA